MSRIGCESAAQCQQIADAIKEFTSIYAMARMDHDQIDRGSIAYLGSPDVEKRRWPAITERALLYRQHNRNYIQQCKEWLQI